MPENTSDNMDSIHQAVTLSPEHAKSSSISTSKSEQSFFSFQTGATARANSHTISSENVSDATDTNPTEQLTVPEVNDGNKTTGSWSRFKTTVRRRHTVQQTSDKVTPTESDLDSPDSILQAQKSPAMLSLPELPQRQSLIEELNVSPHSETVVTAPELSQKVSGYSRSSQLSVPPQYTPKICTKCGKRKRPKLITREQSIPNNTAKPRTTLAVIAEAPVEPPPLLSPTNISETSTVCVPETLSDETTTLGKSSIYDAQFPVDFDATYLVPEKFVSLPPRSTSGLSFITAPSKNESEEMISRYALEDDALEEAAFSDSLSVPDTAALDKILRDMQELIDRTNRKTYSMHEYDFRASPIPREIV